VFDIKRWAEAASLPYRPCCHTFRARHHHRKRWYLRTWADHRQSRIAADHQALDRTREEPIAEEIGRIRI